MQEQHFWLCSRPRPTAEHEACHRTRDHNDNGAAKSCGGVVNVDFPQRGAGGAFWRLRRCAAAAFIVLVGCGERLVFTLSIRSAASARAAVDDDDDDASARSSRFVARRRLDEEPKNKKTMSDDESTRRRAAAAAKAIVEHKSRVAR